MGRAGSTAVAWLGLLAVGCSQAAGHEPQLGHNDQPILDGKFAVQDDILGTVALVDTQIGFAFCTGTLIAPDVVVTAAHCGLLIDPRERVVTGIREPESFAIVAGVTSLADADADDVFPVADLDLHPDFGEDPPEDPVTSLGGWHDIAVVSLARRVDSMVPVPVLASVDELDIGEELLIGGFGTSDRGGETGGGVLRKASVPLVRLASDEFIAGESGTPDTCPGDSGGPVYLERDDASVVLVGVTSRALRDASTPCGEGGIYTLISAHLDYLRETSPTPLASVGGDIQVGGATGRDDDAASDEISAPRTPVDMPSDGVPSAGDPLAPPASMGGAVRGGCSTSPLETGNAPAIAMALGLVAVLLRRRH